jgi:hypothetical protein
MNVQYSDIIVLMHKDSVSVSVLPQPRLLDVLSEGTIQAICIKVKEARVVVLAGPDQALSCEPGCLYGVATPSQVLVTGNCSKSNKKPSTAGPRERARLMVTLLSLGTVHTDCKGISPAVPCTVSSCVQYLKIQ